MEKFTKEIYCIVCGRSNINFDIDKKSWHCMDCDSEWLAVQSVKKEMPGKHEWTEQKFQQPVEKKGKPIDYHKVWNAGYEKALKEAVGKIKELIIGMDEKTVWELNNAIRQIESLTKGG